MKVSLGLGLTNDCNLQCPHCYRPDPPVTHLSFESVRRACESLDVGGVNLGTGENGLHPQFREIVDYLLGRGLPVSLVSNGLSVARLPDEVLEALHDVEISIDHPDPEAFDRFRGLGAWANATGALARCRALGVRVTVLCVLMRSNHGDLVPLARLATEHGALLRVNVYQPVKWLRFAPTYDEFWSAMRDLFEETEVLACSERVVSAAAGMPPNGGLKCGRTSVRVMPSGEVLPCVYWPDAAGNVDDLPALGEEIVRAPAFQELGEAPKACRACPLLAACGGGCASRRMLACGTLEAPDPYCPKAKNVRLSTPRAVDRADRLHTGNVCTVLVRG